jgi:hypothetical protein
MTHQSSSDPVYDYGLGLIRTVVPTVWGGVGSWLVSLGVHLPDGYGPTLVMLLLTGVWYAVWHAVESRLPPGLTRAVLGANTAPSYRASSAGPAPRPQVILKPTETDR